MKKELKGLVQKLENGKVILIEGLVFFKLLILDMLGISTDTFMDEVDLVFDIIQNIKMAKTKSEDTYSIIVERGIPDDVEGALETLCASYTRFYRALEVLRISTLRYSHKYSINNSIFKLQKEIESLLYVNNRVLYNSIQRSTDLRESHFYDLHNSPILERFISGKIMSRKHTTKKELKNIMSTSIG